MSDTYTYIPEWLSLLGVSAAGKMISAVVILLVGCLLVRLVTKLLKKLLERSRLEKAAHSLIISVARVVLYLLVLINVAAALGVDITGVVALASVLTLAVSLAMQSMLANVVGGITILSTHPFRSGDYVDIGDQSGTVEEIGMTYTRLMTPDRKLIAIPNSTVATAQVTNYSAADSRRVDVNVSAAYSADPQTVIDALIQAGTVDKALTDPAPFAAVTGYGESSVQYTLRVWVRTADYWDVFFQINQRVHSALAEHQVEMPYPHVHVHMEK